MDGTSNARVSWELLDEKSNAEKQKANLQNTLESARFQLQVLIDDQDRLERESQPKKIIQHHFEREKLSQAIEILQARLNKVSDYHLKICQKVDMALEESHFCFGCEFRMRRKNAEGCYHDSTWRDLKSLLHCPNPAGSANTLSRDRIFRMAGKELPQPELS